MLLSQSFTLADFTKSDTATRHGVDNSAPPDAVANLEALYQQILHPLRSLEPGHDRRPREHPLLLDVTSGYRCPALNTLVNGSKTSSHCFGEAADIEAVGFSNEDLARRVVFMGLPFDQLILEFPRKGDPRAGWVHVSHRKAGRNRGQVLTATREAGKVVFTRGIFVA